MFKSLLVANRGEIACRVIRTAKKMGVETHAIFHQKDYLTPHVKLADNAHEIFGSTPNSAYLNVNEIISILKKEKIEAVHPGYGFLSEDYSFPRSLEEQKIVYVGPRSESVQLMGDKIKAIEYASSLGISTLKSIVLDGDVDRFISDCNQLSYPIILKLSGAGGGRGLKIIREQKSLLENIIDLKKERERNFGSSNIFAEEYVANPRHIEVQIIGDGKGNIRHFYERECSIQRRYQKIIEETPAQQLKSGLKEKLYEDACKLTATMKYLNAGTVEFLLSGDNPSKYYFLEMNTRIQVEHGITEKICSLDLIEKQMEIAFSNKFDFKQKDISIKGHAIEARVCCEAVDDNFSPRIGKINYLKLPKESVARVDFGVEKGQHITADFDSMIGKLISHGENRKEAIAKLKQGLSELTILGCETNINSLLSILESEDFVNDQVITTNYIPNNLSGILSKFVHVSDLELAIGALLVLKKEHSLSTSQPHQQIFAWQNPVTPIVLSHRQIGTIKLMVKQIYPNVIFDFKRNKSFKIKLLNFSDCFLQAVVNDEIIDCKYLITQNDLHIKMNGTHQYFELPKISIEAKTGLEINKTIKADMPGTVISIMAQQGNKVKIGDILMIIESMKIQTNIISKTTGTIEKIHFAKNESFERGSSLISLSET